MPGLEIAGRAFSSRLIIGTGGFRNLDAMAAAVAASGADMATVAMRRVDASARGSVLDVLDRRRMLRAAQHRRLLHRA